MDKRKFLPLLAFAATLLISSCNRGYGCPTNLSEGLPLEQLGSLLASFVAGLL